MWYLSSFSVLVIIVLLADRLGLWLLSLTPKRLRPHARAAYAPAGGLAILVLIASLMGWAGPGFRTWLGFGLSLGICLLGLAGRPTPRPSARRIMLLLLFSLICSFPWLYTLARYDAFNPYNDAFIYLTQAQWSQNHSFREEAHPSGYYPALTQIKVAQANRWPMGASFLLAWVQASFGAQWSYLVFPAVICVPLVCCGLAVAGMIRFLTRGSWSLCLLGGAAVATGLNGVSFGSTHGFLPQTFALALAPASLGLIGLHLARPGGAAPGKWSSALPLAVLLAALALSYHAILPFAAGAVVLAYAVLLFRRHELRLQLSWLSKVGALTLVLLNFELVRLFHSLPTWAKVVVGTPVPWSPARFLAHAAGFASGAWDPPVTLLGITLLSYAFLLLMLAASIAGLLSLPKKMPLRALAPSVSFLLVAVAGFLYFRYVTPSPWQQGVGQSWSQFKLSNWASPFLVLLVAAGCVSFARFHRWSRRLVTALLGAWMGAGLCWNCALAGSRTAPIRQQTQSPSPFRYYQYVRDSLLQVRKDDGIYLAGFGGAHHKHRQMLVYFLMDYKLLSDWSDDGYLVGHLPVEQRVLPLSEALWVLRPVPAGGACEVECLPPNLQLSPAGTQVTLVGVAGGYAQESDRSGWWRWTADTLAFHYRVRGELPTWVRLRFTYLPAVKRRRVQITLEDTNPPLSIPIIMEPGWGTFVSQPIFLNQREFRVRFSCDQAPERISSQDPRLLAFLIKNLVIETIPPGQGGPRDRAGYPGKNE